MKILTILACLMLIAGCVLALVAITTPLWFPPVYSQLSPAAAPVPCDGPIGLVLAILI